MGGEEWLLPMRASALAVSLCAAVLSAVRDRSFFSYRSNNCTQRIRGGRGVGGFR
jgi:hypothetical protein